MDALTAVGALMTLNDFALSNARRFCSSTNALTAVVALMTPYDVTLSNASRFVLVNGEPLGSERVKKNVVLSR